MKITTILKTLCYTALIATSAHATETCLNFDGTTNINLGSDSSLDLKDNFTLEFWINDQSTGLSTIWADGNTSSGIQLTTNQGALRFTDRYKAHYSLGNIPTNKWVHVALTRTAINANSSTITLFLNGAKINTVNGTTTPNAYTGNKYIGSTIDGAFTGAIDEFRVWNTVRTEQQIYNNFTATSLADTTNLVAWYSYNEASGNTTTNSAPATAGVNNGTISGTVSRTTSHLSQPVNELFPNKGISLDGGGGYGYINNSAAQISGTDPFTVEAWVKTSANGAILSQKTSSWDGYYLFYVDGGKLSLWIYASGVSDKVTSVSNVNDGQWHHVAATRAADGTLKVYIDGVDDSASAVTSSYSIPARPVAIGASTYGGVGSIYTGEIDEVRIWSVARTGSELQQHMFKEPVPGTTGLKAAYTFNSDAISDSSGNGANGSVEGTADSLQFVTSTAPVHNFTIAEQTLTTVGNTAGLTSGLNLDLTAISADNYLYFVQESAATTVDSTSPSLNFLNRHWFTGTFATSGTNTATLEFNRNDLGLSEDFLAGTYYLLKKSSADETVYAIVQTEVTTVEAATVTFSDYDLSSGIYTLGWDADTLTPVIGLQITRSGQTLHWSVNQEVGVESYNVQQWVDSQWQTIHTVQSGDKQYSYELPEMDASYRLLVVDHSGFSQIFTPESGQPQITLQLKTGWNLVSLPFAAEQLDQQIQNPAWIWNEIDYVSTDTVDAQQGFWIYATESQEIQVVGTQTGQGVISLSKGWNLAGPAQNCPIPTGLTVYGFDGTTQDLNFTNQTLVTGRGYWIFTKQPKQIILK